MKKIKEEIDSQITLLIEKERQRQEESLMMIPSENYASEAVLSALGSVVQNKYAEGYPGKRYYQGNKFIDKIESLAIERIKKLFNVPHANVQPYSGSPANNAIYFALLSPGEKIMGLSLPSGGHLTHGHPQITFSGRYFKSIPFSVNRDGFIDYEKMAKLAKKEKPRLIVLGTTAYPRRLDFKRVGEIAEKVGAYFLADISHIAGLVVAGVHPSPVPYADLVMTTTHKTLRGPRGAVILVTEKGLRKNSRLDEMIDRAVFPGFQGGPHENVIAAMAVAFKEAQKESFRKYGKRVVDNARVLAQTLKEGSLNLVTGGTDNHLLLVDLRGKMAGKKAAIILEEGGIVVNANTIPHDSRPPWRPGGIRLGTPALTTRGMGEKEMRQIGSWIIWLLEHPQKTKEIRDKVKMLTKKFPIYND